MGNKWVCSLNNFTPQCLHIHLTDAKSCCTSKYYQSTRGAKQNLAILSKVCVGSNCRQFSQTDYSMDDKPHQFWTHHQRITL